MIMLWNRRFFITTLAALVLSLPAIPATVQLSSKATVPGGKVKLADIAQVQEEDAALKGKIEAVNLGQAPNPGYTRYISKEIIASRLRSQGVDPSAIRFTGAEGALLTVQSAMISGQELTQLGKEFLKSKLSGLEGDFVVESDRTAADLLVPVGAGITTFNVKWHGVPRALGAVVLDLEVLVDDERFTAVPLSFNIRRFAEVLMAVNDIARGETFNAGNTAVVRTEITSVQGNIAQEVKEMAPYVARRDLRAGSVIRAEDGFLPVVVHKDQAVNVTVKKGALLIRSRGVARQNGALGDTVQVANPDSGRIYRCKVTGPNRVAVHL
jgi:flagella basal body P-ring formation protein FlgA